jgi:hypothetical protein
VATRAEHPPYFFHGPIGPYQVFDDLGEIDEIKHLVIERQRLVINIDPAGIEATAPT